MPTRVLRRGFTWFLVLLALPGTLSGASLLAALGGVAMPWVLPASVHGMVQGAAFMTLIHAFLTHALPGMLGADRAGVLRVNRPMRWVGVAVLASVAVESFPSPAWLRLAARVLLAVAACVPTALLVQEMLRSKKGPWNVPFVHLGVGLLLFPLGALVWALQALDVLPGVAAAGLVLVGAATIILSMAYQMLGAMLSLERPLKLPFAAGAAAWMAGGVAWSAGTPQAWAGALMGAGALVVAASLQLHRARRGLLKHVPQGPGIQLLKGHAVVALLHLLVGPWILVFSSAPFAADVARHALALGFATTLTLGITSRVLPRMLGGGRSVPVSAGAANLALLVVGLGLRWARLFPSAPSWLLGLSAALTGMAVVMGCAWLFWATRRVPVESRPGALVGAAGHG